MCPQVEKENNWCQTLFPSKAQAIRAKRSAGTGRVSAQKVSDTDFACSMSLARRLCSRRGVALLVVVSLLTVVLVIGIAFLFSMHLESQAARQFVSSAQARMLAEAGVNHARALLDEDKLISRVDDGTELWAEAISGKDVDMDEDGVKDARWWDVSADSGDPPGRYALSITDEAGKVNLNTGRAKESAFELATIDLTKLLEEAGVRNADTVAASIESYRYGNDGSPGVALVDDDGDGSVDELDEYQPLLLEGDDRRIDELEELLSIAGLDRETIRRLAGFATVYSWDANVTTNGQVRVNVNTATAEELLAVLLDVGVQDPWHAAANLADYVDTDFEISRVTKSAQSKFLADQDSIGSWEWEASPLGHYFSEEPDGAPLEWVLAVPIGNFKILAKGLNGVKIGDVALQGQVHHSVNADASLGNYQLDGTLRVIVTHREPDGVRCAIRGIELVSEEADFGVSVRGIEAIRINEIMVEPVAEFSASSATFSNPQGSDWQCDQTSCVNSGTGSAKWSWTDSTLRAGLYRLRVWAGGSGGTVGNVCLGSSCALLVHGQRHPTTITVGSGGKFFLTIGKTAQNETYSVKEVELSLQPDGEYVELINLTDREVDVSGWTIGGDASLGRIARFPAGARVAPRSVLLAAVDLTDTQDGLAGDGIDARSAWEISADAQTVQLEFPGGGLSPDEDWLKATLPSGTAAHLSLYGGGVLVDEVEYLMPFVLSSSFQSLEKGDPTEVVDSNQDGVDDGWYASLQLYTPGLPNDNDGLKEIDGLTQITHDPAKEVNILNRSVEGIGELAGLSSGVAWEPFASEDLAKLVDRFTVEGFRLEAEGHIIEGDADWREISNGYELNPPSPPEAAGTWQWVGIPDGRYRFSVYGRADQQMAVRWQSADLTYTEWSPALSTDAQGRVVIGEISIGLDKTPSETLTVQVRCESPNGICNVNHVRLDPRWIRVGLINANTASLAVLRSLPGMTDAIASRIIAGRPYGDKEDKGRGIGDLLLDETLGVTEEDRLEAFRKMAHLLTTRSQVFRIVSLGHAFEKKREGTTQRIEAVVER